MQMFLFRLWLYNATLARVFFVTPDHTIKIEQKIFSSKHLYRIPVEGSQKLAWKLPDQEEFSLFISVHSGCDFTPLASPPPHTTLGP